MEGRKLKAGVYKSHTTVSERMQTFEDVEACRNPGPIQEFGSKTCSPP